MWWLAGLLVFQAPAEAATPGSAAFDVQCMLVTQQAATEIEDKQIALANQIAAMFFMGRVDGAVGESQLVAVAEQAGEALKGRPLGPMLVQCGDFMQQRGKVIEKVGAEVQARAGRRSAQ